MKKILLAIVFLISTATVCQADWATEFNNGNNPILSPKNGEQNVYKLFTNLFGQQGLNGSADLLNQYGVDPYTTWTANDSYLIGAYDVANFNHQLLTFNGADQLSSDKIKVNGLNAAGLDKYIGSGTDISFELNSYYDNFKGSPDLVGSSSGGLFNSKGKELDSEIHMLAFDVTDLYNNKYNKDYSDVYMFAWEDQQLGVADWDYNDLIIFMTNITPNSESNLTPEPATLALVGLGLVGVGLFSRRKRDKM